MTRRLFFGFYRAFIGCLRSSEQPSFSGRGRTKFSSEEIDTALELWQRLDPQFDRNWRTTAKRLLALCQRAGHLYLWPASAPRSLVAFFRYDMGDAKLRDAIAQRDLRILERADLSRGDLLHVVTVATESRFRMFIILHSIMIAQNQKATTAHLGKSARFWFEINPGYRKEQDLNVH